MSSSPTAQDVCSRSRRSRHPGSRAGSSLPPEIEACECSPTRQSRACRSWWVGINRWLGDLRPCCSCVARLGNAASEVIADEHTKNGRRFSINAGLYLGEYTASVSNPDQNVQCRIEMEIRNPDVADAARSGEIPLHKVESRAAADIHVPPAGARRDGHVVDRFRVNRKHVCDFSP